MSNTVEPGPECVASEYLRSLNIIVGAQEMVYRRQTCYLQVGLHLRSNLIIVVTDIKQRSYTVCVDKCRKRLLANFYISNHLK